MAQHVLSLASPDTLNACILPIQDTSVYTDTAQVLCPKLIVTPPGFSRGILIDGVQPSFSLNLTACDLGIQVDQCGTVFSELSDGIYIFNWSVSPNEYVYVEYNHLRITNFLNRYYKILCGLSLAACEPSADVKKKLERLREIKQYAEAAKAMVEICHTPDKGMQLFNYAVSQLGKFDCKTC